MAMAVYSVWAAAPEPLRPRLAALMEKLRDEFGGPAFEPHVTVVGAMRLSEDDARRRLRSVCKGIRPYTVRFDGVARGTFFYQCVFLLVEPTSEVGDVLSRSLIAASFVGKILKFQVVEASANSSTHFGFRSSTREFIMIIFLYSLCCFFFYFLTMIFLLLFLVV